MSDNLINLPGVGAVGHSTAKSVAEMMLIRMERALMPSGSPRELCEECATTSHRECTGFSKSGALCACDCREA